MGSGNVMINSSPVGNVQFQRIECSRGRRAPAAPWSRAALRGPEKLGYFFRSQCLRGKTAHGFAAENRLMERHSPFDSWFRKLHDLSFPGDGIIREYVLCRDRDPRRTDQADKKGKQKYEMMQAIFSALFHGIAFCPSLTSSGSVWFYQVLTSLNL